MIWLLTGLFLLLMIAWAVVITGKDAWENDVGGFFTAIAIVFLLPSFLVPTLVTMNNGAGLMKLEAFYQANSSNYAIAVDETASYLSAEKYIENAFIPIEGSIEKFKQSQIASERIKEWRDAVIKYNETIASMKYYNRNIFTGILVPNRVEEAKLLIMQ